MAMRDRVLLGVLVVLATMFLANCNGYSCGGFGALPCTSAGSGSGSGGFGGGGGGGGSTDSVFAYAMDTSAVTMDGYGLNTTAGTFSTLSSYTAPPLPDSEPGLGMVVAQKQFVYAALEEAGGSIYGWSVNSSTGALTALTPVDLSLLVPNGLAFNQYNLATNPAGTLLFVSDTELDEIFVFQISNAGALTLVGSPIVTPFEPGNLATDGLGNYLYVTESLGAGTHVGGTLMLAYSIGTGANLGVLTPVTGSPFTLPKGMWQVQGEPSGGFLIGTSGNNQDFTGQDDLHLYVFSIQKTGTTPGAITLPGSSFPTTYSPFNIAVEPASSTGEFVYSFSINDTDTGYYPVEGFQLNTTTGALTELTNSPFSGLATGHWGQFDQSGDFLFVYSSSLVSGITTTQLGVLDVSSTGQLTQPISSATLVTPGYWVVTDPQ
jgi:6-phosphogluconolactonase (cycloisomerase 2 family)